MWSSATINYSRIFLHKGLDCNPPCTIIGTFPDISKAFDKIWHEGLIFKLQSYRKGSSVIKLLETLSWENILLVVPQGSVLGSTLFLIYINDLPDGLVLTCKTFADDTSLFSKVKGKEQSNFELYNDLDLISGLFNGKCYLTSTLPSKS